MYLIFHLESFRLFLKNPMIKSAILVIVLFFLVIMFLYVLNGCAIRTHNDTKSLELEYYEDQNSSITFEELTSNTSKKYFVELEKNVIKQNHSNSTVWVRLKLDGTAYESLAEYITISGANNEFANIYVPIKKIKSFYYLIMNSGYRYSGYRYSVNEDEGLLYPCFRLSKSVSRDKYIYLQIKPILKQEIEVNTFTKNQYEKHIEWLLISYGLYYGCMISFLVFNLFVGCLILKDKFYQYLIGVIVFHLIIYMMEAGIIKLFSNYICEFVSSYAMIFYWIENILVLLFIRKSCNLKGDYIKANKISKLFIFLFFVSVVLNLLNNSSINNLYDTVVGFSFLVFVYYFIAYLAIIKAITSRYTIIGVVFSSVWSIYNLLSQLGLFHLDDSVFFVPQMFTIATGSILISEISKNYKLLKLENLKSSVDLKNAQNQLKISKTEFLQAQIKPHFLHNAINVIAVLCKSEPLKARKLILDLSDYLKNSFDFDGFSNFISFQKELDFIQAYVRLEQARFRDRITVEYNLDDTQDLMLPPLILQPIIENAIRHGIRKSKQSGKVILWVKCYEDRYRFSISDNGLGMTQDQVDNLLNKEWKKGSGIGISNINSRLANLYGTCLEIESSLENGTTVSFEILK